MATKIGTALVLASAGLMCTPHSAKAIDLTLGGSMDVKARYVEQTDLYQPFLANQDVISDRVLFSQDTYIDVLATGKADYRLFQRYGAHIELLADVTQPSRQRGLNANRTYVFLEGNKGRLELGSTYSAARTMQVNSASFARGTGGIDGDYSEQLNLKLSDGLTGLTSPVFFITAPRLPTDMFYGSSEKANKISYYSPQYRGFQMGVSYTPDTGLRGTAAGFVSEGTAGFPSFDVDGQSLDVISPALKWTGDIGKIGIVASAAAEYAPNQPDFETVRNKLNAYNGGLNLSYGNFIVGGSYGHWGSSISLPPVSGTYYWDVGAGYQYNKLGMSVGYLNADVGEGRYTSEVYSVGADYQLAPGLAPYVEANFFEFDADTAVMATGNKLSGSAIFTGAKLNF